MNNNPNPEDIQNLSVDEINDLFGDIVEMPAPIIAGVASSAGIPGDYGPCLPKGGIIFSA